MCNDIIIDHWPSWEFQFINAKWNGLSAVAVALAVAVNVVVYAVAMLFRPMTPLLFFFLFENSQIHLNEDIYTENTTCSDDFVWNGALNQMKPH